MNLKSSLTALLEGNYSLEYISKHKSNIEEQDYATDYKDGVDNDGDNDGDDIGNDDDYDFVPPPSKGDNHFIRSTLYRLYQRCNRSMNRGLHMLATDKMSAVVLRYKGSELPGFISFTTFTQIYSETLGHWRERTKVYVTNMHQYLYKASPTS